MPQLAVETFVAQYVWLVAVLVGFYYITVMFVVPRISQILKVRESRNI